MVYRLVYTISNIHETAHSISFLCLHLLVNEPECVDMAREVPQDSQADVDEQVTAASGDYSRCGWREQDSYNNEDNV